MRRSETAATEEWAITLSQICGTLTLILSLAGRGKDAADKLERVAIFLSFSAEERTEVRSRERLR